MQPLVPTQSVPISDATVFDALLERATLDQLETYTTAIGEEKELRRLKDLRIKRYRDEMKQEKIRVTTLLEKFKDKLVETIESDDDEPEVKPRKKKAVKKS